jgi:hypothetical protein
VRLRLREALGRGRFADAHQIALGAQLFCPRVTQPRWRMAEAVAVAGLEDTPRALEVLGDLSGDRGPSAARATLLQGWLAWRTRDGEGLGRAAEKLPEPARVRLCLLAALDDLARSPPCPALGDGAARPDLLAAPEAARYRAARHTRRPWLAGVLSGLLPGSGQIYAGSFQGAAVAFLLNAAAIGATVELARHDLYWSAGLTGLAASTVYVGNIVNAVDLARRRNEVAVESAREDIERRLLPERFDPAE